MPSPAEAAQARSLVQEAGGVITTTLPIVQKRFDEHTDREQVIDQQIRELRETAAEKIKVIQLELEGQLAPLHAEREAIETERLTWGPIVESLSKQQKLLEDAAEKLRVKAPEVSPRKTTGPIGTRLK